MFILRMALLLIFTLALFALGLPILYSQADQPSGPVTVSLVGDMMFDSRVAQVLKGPGMAHLFAEVDDILKSDDLTVGNLECAATTRGTAAKKTYVFRMNPAKLPAMRTLGIDVVSVANNHSLDYGRTGFLDTLQALQAAGLPCAGGGKNREEAYRTVTAATPHGDVGVLAASRVLAHSSWAAGANSPGLASAYEPQRLYREVARAAKEHPLLIVYLHWGTEKETRPEAWQRTMAHRCIEEGADAVIGTHPHVLQGFEYYRGKLIAYSLGNFIFSSSDRDTAILQLTFAGDQPESATLIPCRLTRFRPIPVTEKKGKQQIFKALEQISYDVKITERGEVVPK